MALIYIIREASLELELIASSLCDFERNNDMRVCCCVGACMHACMRDGVAYVIKTHTHNYTH
jgi:hypothetical protein